MSRKTVEGDVLREMGATLNSVISQQSDAARFGAALSSAGFVSGHVAEDQATVQGVSQYSKVSRLMAAAKDNITTSGGRHNPGRVTEKFNKFVLLLHDDLDLRELASQLAAALSELYDSTVPHAWCGLLYTGGYIIKVQHEMGEP